MREALVIGREQDQQSEAEGFTELAGVATAQRRYEEAGVMLGAASALREGAEAKQDPVSRDVLEETLSTLRGNLDEDDFTAAWERGRAMTLEQAVEYAVEFIDSRQAAMPRRERATRSDSAWPTDR
jgi:hypothetical protein